MYTYVHHVYTYFLVSPMRYIYIYVYIHCFSSGYTNFCLVRRCVSIGEIYMRDDHLALHKIIIRNPRGH